MSKEKLIKCKVEWTSERCNDNDNNNGLEYGIYTFDVTESEYNQDSGLGAYDVINVEWYKTKKERNQNF